MHVAASACNLLKDEKDRLEVDAVGATEEFLESPSYLLRYP